MPLAFAKVMLSVLLCQLYAYVPLPPVGNVPVKDAGEPVHTVGVAELTILLPNVGLTIIDPETLLVTVHPPELVTTTK